jgi:hypothetical protein
MISTFAGTGSPGFSGDGGPASGAQLRQPHSIAVDPTRRFLLVCDVSNHRVRRVEFATGRIETFADSVATAWSPIHGGARSRVRACCVSMAGESCMSATAKRTAFGPWLDLVLLTGTAPTHTRHNLQKYRAIRRQFDQSRSRAEPPRLDWSA